MNSREQYCLRYESTYLLELGRAIDYLFSFAVTYAAQEALKYTILSGMYFMKFHKTWNVTASLKH